MTIKPSLEEVKNIAKEYNTIPLSCELPMNYTPVGIIKKIRAVSSHCFMLESKEDTKQTGRYTFIGFDPKAEISCTNYSVCVVDDMGVRRFRGNPRSYVKELLDSHKAPRFDYLPDFTGGLVGYFGYDYVKYSEPSLNLNAQDDGSFKDVDLMLFDKVIAFDNAEEKIILIVNIQTDDCEKIMRSLFTGWIVLTKSAQVMPRMLPRSGTEILPITKLSLRISVLSGSAKAICSVQHLPKMPKLQKIFFQVTEQTPRIRRFR